MANPPNPLIKGALTHSPFQGDCWDENPNSRPPFSKIIDVLAQYSTDTFQQSSDDVLVTQTAAKDSNCCIIQ